MKILLIRGEPRFPVVLYCPSSPEVNIEFINIYCIVSTLATVLSPNFSSTVHALMPMGISLFECRESELLFPIVLRREITPFSSI